MRESHFNVFDCALLSFLAPVVALIAGVGATFAALGRSGDAGHNGADRWGLIFMITLDVQLVLGLMLYGVLSPYTAAAMKDFGIATRCAIRCSASGPSSIVTMMVSAVVLVHVGRVLARKTTDADRKRSDSLFPSGSPFC